MERNPSLVVRALETLEHWSRLGNMPEARVEQWRVILKDAIGGAAGLRALLSVLRDDSGEGKKLKEFAPFAGILTREERRKVFLQCSYDY